MIVYLHGFASSGKSPKVDMLKQRFGDANVLAPDLPFDPVKVKEIVHDIVMDFYKNGKGKLIFVGTSLGGFYATYFSKVYDCPAVIVNPSVNPTESLNDKVGVNVNHVTREEFLVSIVDLNTLGTWRKTIKENYNGKLVNLFVAKDDEVLDYQMMLDAYPHTNHVTITDDGGHRYNKHWNLVVDHIDTLIKQ